LKSHADSFGHLPTIYQSLINQLFVSLSFRLSKGPTANAALVKSAIEAVGAKVVFLPPYSPDLSPIEPIELCWSKLKQFLRSRSARTREALDQAMTDVID